MSQTVETKLLLRYVDQASKPLRDTEGNAKRTTVALQGLSRSLVGYAGAFLSVRALMRTTAEAFNYAARVRELADAFKMSTEFISGLGVAAEAHNISLDQMAKLFRFVNVRMNEATRGATKAKRAFNDLGLSFNELAKLSQQDRIFKIFEAVSNMKDPQQQSAALQGIGSEEAVKFLPMLAHGPDFLRNLMGMTGDSQLSEEQTRSIKQMQIEMAAMSRGLKNEWMKALMDMRVDIKGGFEWLKSDGIPMIRDSIRGLGMILRGMYSLLESSLNSSVGSAVASPFKWVYSKLQDMYAAYATIDARAELAKNQALMSQKIQTMLSWEDLGIATPEEIAMRKRLEETLRTTKQVIEATRSGLVVTPAGTYIDDKVGGESPLEADSKMRDFRIGWGQAMKQIEEQWNNSWGEMTAIGKSSAELIARAMASSMDNFFFDAIDGKLKQFKEYLLSFLRDIARAMTQIMTQRIVIGALSGMGLADPASSMKASPSVRGKAGGVSSPAVQIINNTGTPMQGSAQMTTGDMGEAVMSVVLDSVYRNKGGSRDMLRGMLA